MNVEIRITATYATYHMLVLIDGEPVRRETFQHFEISRERNRQFEQWANVADSVHCDAIPEIAAMTERATFSDFKATATGYRVHGRKNDGGFWLDIDRSGQVTNRSYPLDPMTEAAAFEWVQKNS